MKKEYKPPVGELMSRDGMPAQVATELLTTGPRLTNRLRKNCRLAREKAYVTVRERKPIETKLDAKLSEADWTQLSKWLVRAIRRRARVQKRFLRLPERTEPEHPAITGARAGLELAAAQLDLLRDRIEEAQNQRKKI